MAIPIRCKNNLKHITLGCAVFCRIQRRSGAAIFADVLFVSSQAPPPFAEHQGQFNVSQISVIGFFLALDGVAAVHVLLKYRYLIYISLMTSDVKHTRIPRLVRLLLFGVPYAL